MKSFLQNEFFYRIIFLQDKIFPKGMHIYIYKTKFLREKYSFIKLCIIKSIHFSKSSTIFEQQ